jgi:lipid II:glycine glycyltransferase (peptidoglycan interpeptide bridge formation enzyme)
MSATVRELGPAELDGWDAAAVDSRGGHVLQSRAWAEHRAERGWRPRFLEAGGRPALVLQRGWPLIGGGSAYAARGPVADGEPWTGDGSGGPVGEALAAIAAHLAGDGVDVLAADPEVAAGDDGYRAALAGAGFRAIPEIQPSRHRMALRMAGADGDAVFDGIAKATRQRIRRAERDLTRVLRWDVAGSAAPGTEPAGGEEPAADALARFYTMLRATGDRRGFDFAGPEEFVAWWRRALDASHLVYLEARSGADGELLGGLVCYRHGRRLSTAHSADVAETRRSHPGTMHLLRWRAIQLALAEGRDEMDLGGVDVAGARRPPAPGEPTYGLYEHKRSFGAAWVELAGAQERVARPGRYAAGRVASRLARSVGGRP